MEGLFNNIKISGKQEPPEKIVKKYLDKLSEITSGRVFGVIELFDRHLINLKSDPKPIFDGVLKTKGSSPQDYLGAVGENKIDTYEIFITGKTTNEYKYRIAFIEYESFPYPVKLSLDRDIADEIDIDKNTRLDNENEFRDVLESILNSRKLIGIINGLLEIN